jgi:hypothetical protein
MSYVELWNDLLGFMLSMGFVTVPAVEVGPFEFGIFNHKKRKNSQKPGTWAILRNFAPFAVNLLCEFPFSYGFSYLTSRTGIGFNA